MPETHQALVNQGDGMAYYRDNGLALTVIRKIRRLYRKIFNRLLALKLKGARGINVDPSCTIIGLNHISIGSSFRTGIFLRLEACSKYGGQAFAPRIVIKDNVELNDFVHIGAANYVEIGNNVLMASKIYISDHNHGFYAGSEQSDPEVPPSDRLLDAKRSVIIGDNVWLGEFVSILPGVTIGKGSIIGANSVVARDIPEYCIAVGTPARVVKRYDPASKQWEKV